MSLLPLGLGFWATETRGILLILITVVWACGLYDVVAKRPDLDGRHRAAWILIIVLFPIVGTIGYFVARPTLAHEVDKTVAAQQALRGSDRPLI